jgi:hypothetical protein
LLVVRSLRERDDLFGFLVVGVLSETQKIVVVTQAKSPLLRLCQCPLVKNLFIYFALVSKIASAHTSSIKFFL